MTNFGLWPNLRENALQKYQYYKIISTEQKEKKLPSSVTTLTPTSTGSALALCLTYASTPPEKVNFRPD